MALLSLFLLVLGVLVLLVCLLLPLVELHTACVCGDTAHQADPASSQGGGGGGGGGISLGVGCASCSCTCARLDGQGAQVADVACIAAAGVCPGVFPTGRGSGGGGGGGCR